ncbi:N-acetyltransferase GCN5 [Pandoraea anapnoica]|uniref:N-acetyltransferase GCN5 n=1 Tax=Pandoraea anapnoica TaxID=2508301 RepID=A0A5E5AT40_9BURK|nr:MULTISPECIES: GNAT family protein [Pandoraea]VVE59292.1 N-acetyltransferase GCN5 [Pandoraea iniqua]VVE75755.1 N-acetyltransferase GCN5 [Pandoraea anapnoica]
MRVSNPPALGVPGMSLRQLDRRDIDAWFSYLRLPEVVKHTSWDVESARDLCPLFEAIESDCSDSIVRLAIVDDASGALVGTVGFHTISTVHLTAEVAYDVAPSHWGRGIGRAACEAVTKWGFGIAGWVRIQAVVLETNAKSIALLESCQFRREGYLRSYRMVRGVPGNFVIFSRLRQEFESFH